MDVYYEAYRRQDFSYFQKVSPGCSSIEEKFLRRFSAMIICDQESFIRKFKSNFQSMSPQSFLIAIQTLLCRPPSRERVVMLLGLTIKN